MKFSELLGEPEPEDERELPAPDAEPISVFAPVPVPPPSQPIAAEPPPPPPPPAPPAPPAPTTGARSELAELNVRQPVAETPTQESTVLDQLTGLSQVDDDLLPSRRGRR